MAGYTAGYTSGDRRQIGGKEGAERRRGRERMQFVTILSLLCILKGTIYMLMDTIHPKIQQPWLPILDPSVPLHCLIPWGTLQSNISESRTGGNERRGR